MANTYSQIYIHVVFAVKDRSCNIPESVRNQVEKFISGIVSSEGSRVLSIYCNPDHVHILLGVSPVHSISDLVKIIKSKSSKFINDSVLISEHFQWQKGFGAFSNSQSQKKDVIHYILNQKEHHRKQSFKDEYMDFLQKYAVEYDEKYLFTWQT